MDDCGLQLFGREVKTMNVLQLTSMKHIKASHIFQIYFHYRF